MDLDIRKGTQQGQQGKAETQTVNTVSSSGSPASQQPSPIKPIPVAPASPLNSSLPPQKKPSSSPWEEDLDLPPDNKASKPTIIGSLGPEEEINSKAFEVPKDVEEKVGQKIPAEAVQTVINQASSQTKTVPQTTNSSQVAPVTTKENNAAIANTTVVPPVPLSAPSDSDDFDWFGDGLNNSQNNTNRINTVAPPPAPPVQQPVSPVAPTPQIASDVSAPIQLQNSIASTTPLSAAPEVNTKSNTNDAVSPSLNATSKKTTGNTSPVNDSTNKSKRKISIPRPNIKIVLIVIGFLVFVSVAIIALTEVGIVSFGAENVYGAIGIEKLWGGLPVDSQSALAKSFSAMKEHPNFKANGKINLLVDRSVKSEVTAPLINTNSGTSGFQNVDTEISYQNSQSASEANINVKSDLGSSNIVLQGKGENLYVLGNDKIKFSGNADVNSWVKYTISSLKDEVIQRDFFNFNNSGGVSIKGFRSGSEKVDGEICFRYDITSMEIGSSLSSFGITSDMVQSVSGQVWLSPRSKLIKKAVLKITTPTSSSVSQINLDLTFKDYDVANDIKEIDSSKIISGGSNLLSGDAKRKSDINNILSALKEYKNDNGSYPSSNGQLVPLNTADNIIEQALVPKYLSVLPQDENAVFNWYYAYKSDGNTCSVSSRLTNNSDPDGQSVGNVILYIKYNSD